MLPEYAGTRITLFNRRRINEVFGMLFIIGCDVTN